jgi:nucleotide-binding universal stress UspA family protein
MKKILVAYDGEQPGHRALEMAADLAKHYQAEVGIVSVVPVRAGRMPTDPWDDAEVHKTELAEARSVLTGYGIEPAVYELAGAPAAVIEKLAIEQG